MLITTSCLISLNASTIVVFPSNSNWVSEGLSYSALQESLCVATTDDFFRVSWSLTL